jgi:hypothetical protein
LQLCERIGGDLGVLKMEQIFGRQPADNSVESLDKPSATPLVALCRNAMEAVGRTKLFSCNSAVWNDGRIMARQTIRVMGEDGAVQNHIKNVNFMVIDVKKESSKSKKYIDRYCIRRKTVSAASINPTI